MRACESPTKIKMCSSKIYAKSRIFYSTFCIDFGAARLKETKQQITWPNLDLLLHCLGSSMARRVGDFLRDSHPLGALFVEILQVHVQRRCDSGLFVCARGKEGGSREGAGAREGGRKEGREGD